MDTLRQLETQLNKLTIGIRSSEGVNQDALIQSIEVLHHIQLDFKHKKEVSKEFGLIIIDVIPALLACDSLYEEDNVKL